MASRRAGAMPSGTKIFAPSPVAAPPMLRARPWLPSVAATSESGRRGSRRSLSCPDLFQSPKSCRKTILQGPVDGPRCAKDLESGQSEPARFVLNEDLPDPEGLGELRGVDQWGLLVARQPAVESQGCRSGRGPSRISPAFGLMSVLMLTVTADPSRMLPGVRA